MGVNASDDEMFSNLCNNGMMDGAACKELVSVSASASASVEARDCERDCDRNRERER